MRAKDPAFSVSRSQRFQLLPQSGAKYHSNLPLTYATTIIAENKDIKGWKGVSQGYGVKLTYKTSKADEEGPGPIYQTDYIRSIKHNLDSIEPRKNSTFGCPKEQRQKLIYHGQEKHYYGSESPGPGTY
jgi:hypothetical protein